jgi:molybdenum cofactor guanylyltransferase
MKLSAVILAGGKSSRMGRDKARLEIGGQSLLARQIQLMQKIGAGEIFVSGRSDRDDAEFGCPVLTDRFAEAGPLAGIERALAAAAWPWLLVVAVDMPNLTPDILRRLIERSRGATGVIPRVGGRLQPLAAIYPRGAGSLATAQLTAEVRAAAAFAEHCVRSGLAEFQDVADVDAHHFTSWNTPADVRPGRVGQPDRCGQ